MSKQLHGKTLLRVFMDEYTNEEIIDNIEGAMIARQFAKLNGGRWTAIALSTIHINVCLEILKKRGLKF